MVPSLAEQVRELARKGCGPEEIVSSMTAAGYDACSVRRVLPAVNDGKVVHSAGFRDRWTTWEAERLEELWGRGMTAREIAEQLGTGRSPKAVNDRMRYLRRAGKRRIYASSDIPQTAEERACEIAGLRLPERRIALFGAARFGATKAEIFAKLPGEDRAWIEAELATMVRVKMLALVRGKYVEVGGRR